MNKSCKLRCVLTSVGSICQSIGTNLLSIHGNDILGLPIWIVPFASCTQSIMVDVDFLGISYDTIFMS